jgi:hypothetical protein
MQEVQVMQKVTVLIKDDRGAITMLTVILLAAFVGILALIIDLGHLHTVQGELRNAADACALRGARAFLPDDIPTTGVYDIKPDPLNAELQAQETILVEKSDNTAFQSKDLDLPTADIQVGIWDYTNRQLLTPWQWPPDESMWGQYIGPGISLPTRRGASTSLGPVSMTLANIFGISMVPVNAMATAALSGVGGFHPDSPVFPGGPSTETLPKPKDGTYPDYHATMRDDGNDTFGWTNLNPADTNPNANELKTIMNHGTLYDCPVDSTVGIQNGVASTVIQEMLKPNNLFGLVDPDGDKVYQPDAAHADSIYLLPVFKTFNTTDPSKFNQSAVVGAVPVKIIQVTGPPENTIDFKIVGGYIAPNTYSGGPWYGALSTEPKLVQ